MPYANCGKCKKKITDKYKYDDPTKASNSKWCNSCYTPYQKQKKKEKE